MTDPASSAEEIEEIAAAAWTSTVRWAAPATAWIDGAWRDHKRWAITSSMTGIVPADPHPTRSER